MIISYNDILKRHIALTATADDVISENCRLYYNQYKNNPSKDKFIRLVSECGKSTECANKYSSFIFNSLEKYNGDDKVLDLVKENVGIRLVSVDKNTPYFLAEQVKLNKLCDRIYNNHNKITSKNKSIEEAFKNNADKLILTECICSTVDKFNLGTVGKVSVALDEMNLMSELNSIDTDHKTMTRDIVSYFMIRNNVNPDKILEAAENGINTLSSYVNFISNEVTPIDAFKLSANKDLATLNTCIDAMIVDASPAKFIFGFEKILNLFEQLMIASINDELIDGILNENIVGIFDIFCRNYIDNDKEIPNLKATIKSCISILNDKIDRFIHICNTSSMDNDLIRKRLCEYTTTLKILCTKFTELDDSIYPEYNASILCDTEKCNEDAKIIDSVDISSIREELSSVVETVSKSIDDKIKGKSPREKSLNKLVHLNHAIFRESGSIFDIVDINTNMVDTSVSVYEMEDDSNINAEIMEAANDIIKDINRFELNESDYKCYFVNMGCILEFRLISNTKVNLDAPEIRESYSYMSGLNQYLIGKMMNLVENDLQPLSPDRISTLLNECSDIISVDDSLELLHCAGISKAIIESANIENLSTKDSMTVSKYESPDYHIDESNAMIAWGFINEIINEADNKNNKNVKSNDKNNKDKDEIKSKGFNINFEKIQLFLQGLKSTAKNLSTKEQEICRQIDSTLNHFVDSVKNAVKADNREQVIKGSVIPSFSKCIKIGIVAAGAFGIAGAAGLTFAPAVPAIIIFGAFAGSKMLMREEQQALMDELEIELRIIDKQIEQTEGDNKPKKMRALLRTQKQLQREYQRLKLGNKIGKQLNSSKTGVPSNNR